MGTFIPPPNVAAPYQCCGRESNFQVAQSNPNSLFLHVYSPRVECTNCFSLLHPDNNYISDNLLFRYSSNLRAHRSLVPCSKNYGVGFSTPAFPISKTCNFSDESENQSGNWKLWRNSSFYDYDYIDGCNNWNSCGKETEIFGMDGYSLGKDIRVWNEKIRELIENSQFADGIRVYVALLSMNVVFDKFTLPRVIKAFGGISDSRKGKQIHAHVVKFGFCVDTFVANSLMAMYTKCGAMDCSLKLFDRMHEIDVISWNTLIGGFRRLGKPNEALETLQNMQLLGGLRPNLQTCLAALSVCASHGFLLHGRETHSFSIKNGFISDLFVGNSIIDMYMKCGHLMAAEKVFHGLLQRNAVTYNLMIIGYVHYGCELKALMMFCEILISSVIPDSATAIGVLVSCSQLLDFEHGRCVHAHIIKHSLDLDTRVATALIDMYFKCGSIDGALLVFKNAFFRNLVMWGVVIKGCARNAYPYRALDFFSQMRQEGVQADSMVIVSTLRVCSSLSLLNKAKEVHAFSIRMGYDTDMYVGSALVDVYAKDGDVSHAHKVLLRMPMRDVISWNALISGYIHHDHFDDGLMAFQAMQLEDVKPNSVTISSILRACGQLSVFHHCKQIHGYHFRNGLESNVLVCNSLIVSYLRCGDIDHARMIFNQMPEKDETTWNSMILGCGMHGLVDDSLDLLTRMQLVGITPSDATFTGILSACSHAGRVKEGWECFRSLIDDYGIVPKVEHYTCMVDLLGRASHLNEAYELIKGMPCEPDALIWGSLLGACKIHGNQNLAESVAEHLFDLDPEIIGYHVLLSNLYADFGKFDDIARIRGTLKEKGARKNPGCSWIEVNNKVHVFLAGDRSHPQHEEIYATLDNLTRKLKEAGCVLSPVHLD
ncbi:hypothetical protein AMTRI_Chr05g71220 [Amborella trichopoda]